MISKEVMSILYKDIEIYNKKKGKDYLIVFGKGKKDKLKCCEITFYDYNFWHLIGCQSENKNHSIIYEACRNKEDISNEISLVHSYAEVKTKHLVFEKVFDFVTNAKLIKIGYIGDCPEHFYLTMSMGDANGFVGCDYPRNGNKKFLLPKSVQAKKISAVISDMNKILIILSKKQNEECYTTIEYEIKKGIALEYLSNISEDIKIDIIKEK